MNNLEKAIGDAVYGDTPEGTDSVGVAAHAARDWFINAWRESMGDFDYVLFLSKQQVEQ